MHIGPIVNVGLAAVLVSLSCSLCTTFRSFMHVLFNLSPECLILGNLHCGINTSHFLYVARLSGLGEFRCFVALSQEKVPTNLALHGKMIVLGRWFRTY